MINIQTPKHEQAETDIQTQTDTKRQSEGQTETQTEGQQNTQAETGTYRHTDKTRGRERHQADRETRDAGTLINSATGKQKQRKRDTQRETAI